MQAMDDIERTEQPDPATLQEELESADPADAPEIAESLAASLGDELDDAAPSPGTSS